MPQPLIMKFTKKHKRLRISTKMKALTGLMMLPLISHHIKILLLKNRSSLSRKYRQSNHMIIQFNQDLKTSITILKMFKMEKLVNQKLYEPLPTWNRSFKAFKTLRLLLKIFPKKTKVLSIECRSGTNRILIV